jgi:hypothetical protein
MGVNMHMWSLTLRCVGKRPCYVGYTGLFRLFVSAGDALSSTKPSPLVRIKYSRKAVAWA